MDLQTLQAFLDHNAIPKIKKRTKTFLGIAKQPHYENVMSNIYAFYFDVNEAHGMSDLFVSTLLELIADTELGKTKKIDAISVFDVDTEVSTKKNGRIDLLLSNENHAIIIENKVYHILNNDLQDYWSSIRVIDNIEDNKIGVVLSLNKLNIIHPHFINITHLDFLKRVIQNSGSYLMEAKDKYVVFLKDFYQNTLNMSKSELNSKELKFYFDNQAKIIEAKDFHFAVRTHVANQIEQVIELVDEAFVLQSPKGEFGKRLRFFLSPKNKNLMITVFFDRLLTTEKRLILVVELKEGLLTNKEQYQQIVFSEREQLTIKSDFYTNGNSKWCHFAVMSYVLNENEVSNLAQFISEKLNNDGLLSIYTKLNDFIPKINN